MSDELKIELLKITMNVIYYGHKLKDGKRPVYKLEDIKIIYDQLKDIVR